MRKERVHRVGEASGAWPGARATRLISPVA